MALILHIETASPVCSVALSRDGNIIGLRESSEEKSHAVRLTLFIDELLKEQGIGPSSLDAVSLSMGPGSYTGLRIGTSVAKGFAYGAGIPLIGLPTLKILAAGFIAKHHPKEGLLCPMLDARRMEVYTALFDITLNEHLPTEAHILDEGSFQEYLLSQPVYFFGSGSTKTPEVIRHPNAIQGGPFPLSAAFQSELAEQEFARGAFLDTAYFEPHYLKEFIASIPKNKVL
jgi:tRNA threonylcarbamoyladenosine biosynthesis protein TsaB